jgi:6-phosphogluconolactonase (cycloisomerase 2 family)
MSSNYFPRSATKSVAAIAFALVTSLLVVACGGGGDSVTKTPSYTIGGSVSGMVGSGLALEDNGGDNLAVTASGPFTFARQLTNGSSYAVTVATQPTSPTQTCVVTSGSGSVIGANVESVAVACTTNGYTVGGSVSGLTGTGLVLQDNAGNDLPVSAAGNFTFAQTVGSSLPYAVTVKTQPINPIQTCVVASGTGTVATANITNVAITCTTGSFTLSGTITGLAGSGLTLSTVGVNIPITGSTFSVSLASGTAYNVVATQPTGPSQTCAIGNGSGSVTNANISNVTVTCTTNTYSVGGSVSGLAGTGLALENGVAGAAIPIAANGTGLTFVTLPSGGSYNIMVKTPPQTPSQTCVVANPSGPITNAAITNVTVTCTTNLYTIGGTISGLSGTGLVLQDNGGDSLPVTANGMFTFATQLTNGAAYAVTVQTQPQSPAQYCVVTNGSGNVAAANVSIVAVTCRNEGKYAFVIDTLRPAIVTQPGNVSVPQPGTVSAFTIAPITGALGLVNSPVAVDANPISAPVSVAVNPAGTVVYTANAGTTDISYFSVDGASGALTLVGSMSTGTAPPPTVPPTPPADGSTPSAITINPLGGYALVADSRNGVGTGEILVFPLDPTTGAPHLQIAGSPFVTAAAPGNNTSSVVVDPMNLYVFATNEFYSDPSSEGLAAFTFNSPTNGNLTGMPTWQVVTGVDPVSVVVDPRDMFVYVSNSGDPTIPVDGTISGYTLGSLGALTPMNSGTAFPVAPGAVLGAIAIDPTGRFLYVADSAHNKVVAFTIDQNTGVLAPLAPATGNPFATDTTPFAVSIDPSGHFLYVGNSATGTISMFTTDPTTGALTPIGTGLLNYGGTGANAIAIE